MITGEKVDAYRALESYETPEDFISTSDPYGLLNTLIPNGGLAQQKFPPIPVLVSEGFRDVFSVDTKQHNEMVMESLDKSFVFDLVGLISKAGHTTFTSRKLIAGLENWGKSVQTTFEHFNILLDELKKDDPTLQKKLD